MTSLSLRPAFLMTCDDDRHLIAVVVIPHTSVILNTLVAYDFNLWLYLTNPSNVIFLNKYAYSTVSGYITHTYTHTLTFIGVVWASNCKSQIKHSVNTVLQSFHNGFAHNTLCGGNNMHPLNQNRNTEIYFNLQAALAHFTSLITLSCRVTCLVGDRLTLYLTSVCTRVWGCVSEGGGETEPPPYPMTLHSRPWLLCWLRSTQEEQLTWPKCWQSTRDTTPSQPCVWSCAEEVLLNKYICLILSHEDVRRVQAQACATKMSH